jgi:hypothetical protein
MSLEFVIVIITILDFIQCRPINSIKNEIQFGPYTPEGQTFTITITDSDVNVLTPFHGQSCPQVVHIRGSTKDLSVYQSYTETYISSNFKLDFEKRYFEIVTNQNSNNRSRSKIKVLDFPTLIGRSIIDLPVDPSLQPIANILDCTNLDRSNAYLDLHHLIKQYQENFHVGNRNQTDNLVDLVLGLEHLISVCDDRTNPQFTELLIEIITDYSCPLSSSPCIISREQVLSCDVKEGGLLIRKEETLEFSIVTISTIFIVLINLRLPRNLIRQYLMQFKISVASEPYKYDVDNTFIQLISEEMHVIKTSQIRIWLNLPIHDKSIDNLAVWYILVRDIISEISNDNTYFVTCLRQLVVKDKDLNIIKVLALKIRNNKDEIALIKRVKSHDELSQKARRILRAAQRIRMKSNSKVSLIVSLLVFSYDGIRFLSSSSVSDQAKFITDLAIYRSITYSFTNFKEHIEKFLSDY